MVKVTVADVKKYLKALDQKELIRIITELYKTNKPVQEYFSVKLMGETAIQELFEKAQTTINNEFFPSKGHGKLRLSVAKKAINDFKKQTGDEVRAIDLMIYYVELGTEFTNTYGDIDLPFYNSLLSVFDKVVDACEKDEQLYHQFGKRLYCIVEESSGVGWGYHDGLNDLYYSLSWLEA